MKTRIAGRYQLVREIGAGSMGRVFQALDMNTGDTVAARVLIPSNDLNLSAVLQFQQESAVLTVLKHPSIVRVSGIHVEETMSAIVMELLEGCPVREGV